MRRSLWHSAPLVLLCIAQTGCGKPQTREQTFTRELEPGRISSPVDLLTQAENARSPEEKLALFQQLVTAYPDSPQADEAQFMVGFVLLEDMSRIEEAQAAFRTLRDRYPSSEWNDDADKLMADAAPPEAAPPS